MFTVGGDPSLVVDAQVHIWDASPHNQAIPDGEVVRAGPAAPAPGAGRLGADGPAVPSYEVERVTEHSLNRDVFGDGHVDRAVLQPVVLDDLFVLGFSPLEWHAEMAGWMPGRFVLSGELDPGGGQPGARGLTPRVRRFGLRGLTLCERRRPAGRLSLADPWLRRTLARCGQAGADVVHIGVGPSTRPAPVAAAGRGTDRRPTRPPAAGAALGRAGAGRLGPAGPGRGGRSGRPARVRRAPVPGAGRGAAADPASCSAPAACRPRSCARWPGCPTCT